MARKMTLRRLRQNSFTRELARSVRINVDQMIQPHFVVEGIRGREGIPGLSSAGTYRETPESLLKQIEKDMECGIRKFLLFGVPQKKSKSDFNFEFTESQIRSIKKRFGRDLFLAVDVCLCSLTEHGQCGVLSVEGDHVDNAATVSELANAAMAYAQAGADCVAPSDMMDGRIAAIREALDGKQLEKTLIMSYSAKFSSKFYGPFRVAADSAPRGEVGLKDRSTYQIDPANPNDAYLSSLRDSQEGADILMVKPGLPYLDVLAKLSKKIPKPWAVYEVSGEYAAIELLAERNLIDGPRAHVEAWISLKRAGASIIISYGARHAHKWLKGEFE